MKPFAIVQSRNARAFRRGGETVLSRTANNGVTRSLHSTPCIPREGKDDRWSRLGDHEDRYDERNSLTLVGVNEGNPPK